MITAAMTPKTHPHPLLKPSKNPMKSPRNALVKVEQTKALVKHALAFPSWHYILWLTTGMAIAYANHIGCFSTVSMIQLLKWVCVSA